MKLSFISKSVCAVVAAMTFVACQSDITEVALEKDVVPASVASKLVFNSTSAVSGQLLVKFDAEALSVIESAVSRSGATRSGIEKFDAVLESIGVRSIEQVFPLTSNTHTDAYYALGMDRWYMVTFDETADLDRTALAMAEVGEVERVEFDQKIHLLHDGNFTVVPEGVAAAAETRAATAQFNDPGLSKQWHYINIGDTSVYSGAKAGADVNCGAAWSICAGDPSVIVAIVDHPVDYNHPDLAANMWVNEAEKNGLEGVDDDGNGYVDDVYGFNFVDWGPVNVVLSENGGSHGTHVGGTVAAVNNNNRGCCGIAGGTGNNDGVKLMSCQIFRFNTSTGNDYVASSANSGKAIKYAADNGAQILQCSYGYDAETFKSDGEFASRDSAEKVAIDYFTSVANGDVLTDGGLAIYASGNDMTGMSGYPAGYRKCLSVTAISCDYTPAYYTNYGPGCNIAAPGGDSYQSLIESGWKSSASAVYSTLPNNKYGFAQGTSMACPHMSGVAALGLAYAHKLGKKYTRQEFYSLLASSVFDVNAYCVGTKQYVNSASQLSSLDLTKHKGKMGTGSIDAYRLLMNIEGTPCITIRQGVKKSISLAPVVGTGSSSLTYIGVEISKEAREALGVEGSISISSSGKMSIKCNKAGAAKMKVRFIAGGDSVADDNRMGGIEVSREFAVICRGVADNGGWL